jgi:hypothetical protein
MTDNEETSSKQFQLDIVEHESCYMAFVDHMHCNDFLLQCLEDVMKHWEIKERPLVALFHDRITVLTSKEDPRTATGDIELVGSLGLEQIFKPGASVGRRLLKTQVQVSPMPEAEGGGTGTLVTTLDVMVVTREVVPLDQRELLTVECQQGYNVIFGVDVQ